MSPLLARIGYLFQGVAFWSAIALAVTYPAVLLAIDRGLLPRGSFAVLIAAHLLALVAGHRYPGSRDLSTH